MLKKMPTLDRFKKRKQDWRSHIIIGENGGNDEWPIKCRIWSEPHERTWRWSYKCEGELLTPKNGVAYGPKEGSGEGCSSAAAAHQALKEAVEKDYA